MAGCGKKVSTFLQLLKETYEISETCELLKWTDIDLEQRSARITQKKAATRERS